MLSVIIEGLFNMKEAIRLIEDGKQLTKVLSVHKANPVCIPIISRKQIGANNLIPNAVEIAAA